MKLSALGYLEDVEGGRITIKVTKGVEALPDLVKQYRGRLVDVRIGDLRLQRSVDISTHFHAHITQIARETGIERDRVYMEVLLLACEIEPPIGGDPYPYVITKSRARVQLPSGTVVYVPGDVLLPKRTTARTNREMMTAVEAAHYYAATRCDPPVILNEKEEEWM